jgi:hypothetical protein
LHLLAPELHLAARVIPFTTLGVDVVHRSSAKFAVAAALAAASTVTVSEAQTPQRTPQWPLVIEDAKAAKAGDTVQSAEAPGSSAATPSTGAEAQAPTSADHGWTESEIETARARCNVIIAQYDATATPLGPIREGDCGSPHPVQLTRVGPVTLRQPATVNCEVIAALGDWLKVDVQPAAKQYFGSRVVSLDVLSSYSCRNAYGRKKTRLSEHGRANAIDIAAFHFEHQPTIALLADWGMTERDIKARIAAAEAAAKAIAAAKAKAEAEAQAKAVAEAEAKARARESQGGAVADSAGAARASGMAPTGDGLLSLRGMVRDPFGKAGDDRGSSALSLQQPSRLGGPKAKSAPKTEAVTAAPAEPPSSPSTNGYTVRQMFLRAIHAAACKRFGTVLGPEANEAHRNHFHLDMADRGGRGSFCE